MRARLLALHASGELARLAREHRTIRNLAESLGVERDALKWTLDRLRKSCQMPGWDALKFSAWDPTEAERDAAMEFAVGQPAQPSPGNREPDMGIETPIAAISAPVPAHPRERTISDDMADRRTRAEVSSLRSRLKDAIDQLEQCRYELAAATAVHEHVPKVPPIRPREHTSGMREAAAVALASDWHIEETVERENVNGVNEYNLVIAHRRCERYFAGLIYLIRYHQDHFAIRDLILWLGGDLITGYLREEDLEANGASPVEAVAILVVWLSEGIRSVLQGTDIELLSVVCNSGNHGRLTKKMQPRTREANSIEWLMYTMLAREFAGEPRVKFTLPHGSQTYVDVYETTIRFTHGDETKFGGGVGGIMIPIRKAIAKWQTVRHADLTVIGHYHQEHFLRDLVVNGSLVGYNEYALSIAAPYEDPRQGFFLVDKHRGVTFPATIWVADR